MYEGCGASTGRADCGPLGGFGGAGGVAPEYVHAAVPDFLEYFSGVDLPTFPALEHGEDGLIHYVNQWYRLGGFTPGVDEPVLPTRAETCVRWDYVDREVVGTDDGCAEADFEIVAAGNTIGFSVPVGSPPYEGPEFWAHRELRLYY